MDGIEIADLKMELAHAKEMRGVLFILLAVLLSVMFFGTFWLSSANVENIKKASEQSAQISQLTIERDVLLKVQCTENSSEDEEETAVENADLSAQVNF